MAKISTSLPDPNSEEYKEFIERMSKQISNYYNLPSIARASFGGTWIYSEEYSRRIIPFEQDEDGFYGYKTLIRIPESPWFWSPNRFHNSEWVDNHLKAHTSPLNWQEAGIYATKDLESLKEWFDVYTRYHNYSIELVHIFAVKIRVWGDVVEHTTGFRAEYAEIMEVLNGHW